MLGARRNCKRLSSKQSLPHDGLKHDVRGTIGDFHCSSNGSGARDRGDRSSSDRWQRDCWRPILFPGCDRTAILHPDEEVTLIASEDLDRVKVECGINLLAGQHRRNLVTQGVDLNCLIGRFFEVGPVKMTGRGSCEPCAYLEGLTTEGVISALAGCGGLRASILNDGIIRVGDPVQVP